MWLRHFHTANDASAVCCRSKAITASTNIVKTMYFSIFVSQQPKLDLVASNWLHSTTRYKQRIRQPLKRHHQHQDMYIQYNFVLMFHIVSSLFSFFLLLFYAHFTFSCVWYELFRRILFLLCSYSLFTLRHWTLLFEYHVRLTHYALNRFAYTKLAPTTYECCVFFHLFGALSGIRKTRCNN